MRKWIFLFWLLAIMGAFFLHLFALLEIYSLVFSSVILFVVIFLFIIWATSKNRFRGFSSSRSYFKKRRS
ncbi:hypothetical protein [Jeotgalibacillus soli]|uniref:Uncharacterized protein n=1 Tax=Jeotgalibacillus soli TaxID=889306 RepID=A0A0C2RVB9_9BACL|nr:hypothetical protein [Jeotgalibacillus soli]KIL45699.1 hypothetical protein KP78_20480 [Jeotgalibacillus soli]